MCLLPRVRGQWISWQEAIGTSGVARGLGALAALAVGWLATGPANAALLAYEPFTNAPGSAIIGSSGGFGFAGSWQANGSAGTATNTSYGLSYSDGSNTLLTTGGAGFFQGLTTANTSMQPTRAFHFSRGTNGTDGVTTWISFLAVRQGPAVAGNNPYPRGANVPHDLSVGGLQKLAIGNSTGAATNTVGLIPLGSASQLRPSRIPYSRTNLIVVRIDHKPGALDDAYLFVNPPLGCEPSLAAAVTNTLGTFDFSFDSVRVFAGGDNSGAGQPYAELIIDEYRVGETYADVTPFQGPPPPSPALVITHFALQPTGIVFSGTGGIPYNPFLLLTETVLHPVATNWAIATTQSFAADGSFHFTNPVLPAAPGRFFQLQTAAPPAPVAPCILVPPQDLEVPEGETALFQVVAGGTPPLSYQWFFNTHTPLANATNASLAISNVQPAHAGGYQVVVTNPVGAVTSAVATLTVVPAFPPNTFFVSPTGDDANPGTWARPFRTITKGLNTISNGGLVYLRGGVYPQSTRLSLNRTTASATNRFRLWAYPGEIPVIDSTGNTSDGISISGHYYHLKGLVQRYAGHNGINISGRSNIVESCVVYGNTNTGIHLTGSAAPGPSYNLILNCDSYLNYDPPVGGNADGFSAKWTIGPGNVFRGCRAWWNSDDGWDLWMGTSPVLIESCWAFANGTNYWQSPSFNGNGVGFKLGGNYVGAPHRLLRSVAFHNRAHGVDQNNNIAGQTVDNNTAWANGGRNFNLNHGTNTTPHIVRNNLSIAGGSSDSFRTGTLATNNSWQVLSPPAAITDVLSVDAALATAPRQADGSLPVNPFLRPVPGGRLIDRGVDLGEPFTGAAPDLGAFEASP